MTFAPTKKTSKSRTRTRTTAWIKRTSKKLEDKTTLNKEKTWLAHFIDENWFYKWKQVLKPKIKSKKVTRI